jgi:hypothetical protein
LRRRFRFELGCAIKIDERARDVICAELLHPAGNEVGGIACANAARERRQ